MSDNRYGFPPDGRVVERGTSDTTCGKCGSHHYVDINAGQGKVRRDCDECGFFIDWTKWPETPANENGNPK